jgi:hypothetical protein
MADQPGAQPLVVSTTGKFETLQCEHSVPLAQLPQAATALVLHRVCCCQALWTVTPLGNVARAGQALCHTSSTFEGQALYWGTPMIGCSAGPPRVCFW